MQTKYRVALALDLNVYNQLHVTMKERLSYMFLFSTATEDTAYFNTEICKDVLTDPKNQEVLNYVKRLDEDKYGIYLESEDENILKKAGSPDKYNLKLSFF